MNQNKKILILANMDIWVYKLRKEIIEKLIQEQYDVFIAIPKGNKHMQLKKMGCKCIDVKLNRRGTNPIEDFKLFLRYLRILKIIKPDIVLTYTVKPNLYGGIACRIKKVKCIANVTGLGTSIKKKGILNKIIRILYKVAFKNVKCIFCQNKDNIEYLIKIGIDKNNLKLLPGSGVNLKEFQLLKYPQSNKVCFSFIGRIMKEKGIDEYLETAKYIKNLYPNTEFNVLGFCEEKYEQKLKKLESCNIIKYHGMKDNIIPYLKLSHCIILPSYHEGMSNVLLEASAAGRPVIGTDISGCKEIIDNNINGYTVKVKDEKDLIKKVETFIKKTDDEKAQMGLEGRKKIERQFSREIVVNAYIKEINNLIERK